MMGLKRLERLESRSLMAVTATFSPSSGVLTVHGDGANNHVEIDGTGFAGQVNVTEGTSGTIPHGTFSGVTSINVNLRGGDDTLLVGAIKIGGSLKVITGTGKDFVAMDNTPDTGPEPDGATLIGNSLVVNLGRNDGDNFRVNADGGFGITVGRNVKIAGAADVAFLGAGNGSAAGATDLNIGGSLKVTLSGHGDANGDGRELDMDDVNVFGSTGLTGSAARDRVEILESSFVGRVKVNLKGEDDLLDLDGGAGNRFDVLAVFNFGSGTDTLDQNANNNFAFGFISLGGPENTP